MYRYSVHLHVCTMYTYTHVYIHVPIIPDGIVRYNFLYETVLRRMMHLTCPLPPKEVVQVYVNVHCTHATVSPNVSPLHRTLPCVQLLQSTLRLKPQSQTKPYSPICIGICTCTCRACRKKTTNLTKHNTVVSAAVSLHSRCAPSGALS